MIVSSVLWSKFLQCSQIYLAILFLSRSFLHVGLPEEVPWQVGLQLGGVPLAVLAPAHGGRAPDGVGAGRVDGGGGHHAVAPHVAAGGGRLGQAHIIRGAGGRGPTGGLLGGPASQLLNNGIGLHF